MKERKEGIKRNLHKLYVSWEKEFKGINREHKLGTKTNYEMDLRRILELLDRTGK